ncbi:hypothetical protein NECAME_13049 [Necator americanus]|uniref:Uncharacterized protein n=1 Tax=Necator americanus TaxID=51031 RepID=W2SXG5_NECAM|nr:hypothetical protein NECAME_13049 [Necator americanus]ETN74305.1 hypothetical protein NECAME_13049 [Necator americanus]
MLANQETTIDFRYSNAIPLSFTATTRSTKGRTGTYPETSAVFQFRKISHNLEYLDEAMMVNPPPVAEQFLADLRRVIETARERIRMRRFVPMLITIPEDHEETTSSVVQENEPNNEESHVINQQESPKSDKSVDSGRESRSDSDDSSKEEEEDEEVQPQKDENPQNEERKGSVRNLVHGKHVHIILRKRRIIEVSGIFTGFETRSSPTTQLPKPSRIPPRIPAKPRAPPTSQIPTLLGESSPRPLQKSLSLARVPSLPKTSPPRMPSESRARKGYAVFPADPMLNKSLPRRKRAIPRLVAETSSSTSTASS